MEKLQRFASSRLKLVYDYLLHLGAIDGFLLEINPLKPSTTPFIFSPILSLFAFGRWN